MMTPLEQRIAIAEWMGWSDISDPSGYIERTADNLVMAKNLKLNISFSDEKKGFLFGYIPNYSNDLNMMHEAEKRLARNQWAVYLNHLELIVSKFHVGWETFDNIPRYYYTVHASSQQRSEALCRTLWPERFE